MAPTSRLPVIRSISLATVVAVILLGGPAWPSPARATTGPTTGPTTEPALTPLTVSDPGVTSGLAWHLDAIGARAAWRASLGASVTVAVVEAHPTREPVIDGCTFREALQAVAVEGGVSANVVPDRATVTLRG